MKIIIMGIGESGYELAKRLVEDGHDIVAIDNNIDVLKTVSNKLDCIYIQNEGNNFEAIKKANVSDASFFFALTSQDEVNLIACRFASSENPNLKTIAGVRDYSYSSLLESQKALLGISYVFNGKIEVAKHALNTIKNGIFGNPVHFNVSGFALREIKMQHTSSMCNKTVQDIRSSSSDIDFVIAAIYRGEEYIIPRGETVIEEGDMVYFFAHESTFNKIFSINISQKNIKRILIFGVTDISVYIAQRLIEYLPKSIISKSRSIVMMDIDHNNCIRAVEKIPHVLTLEDSIIEHDRNSSYADYDIFIAATNNQELNLISSLHAKNIGIKSVLAIVQKNAYMKIASNLDIDTTISILNSSVDTFMAVINSKHMKSVHSIFSGEVEVVEFSIDERSKIKNKMIKDIKLPLLTLILFIERDNKILIPNGSFQLLEGDIFACIGTRDSIRHLQGIINDKL